MLVELSDRVAELELVLTQSGQSGAIATVAAADSIHDQTLSALVNLGYPKTQAERALAGAAKHIGDSPTLEDLVRGSLKMLVKP